MQQTHQQKSEEKTNDPPNSALLTDFFIKNVRLMNESAFPLSVSVNHPPTSAALQFQSSQFVPITLPNLRHHPRRATGYTSDYSKFLISLVMAENIMSVRGVTQSTATICAVLIQRFWWLSKVTGSADQGSNPRHRLVCCFYQKQPLFKVSEAASRSLHQDFLFCSPTSAPQFKKKKTQS